MRAYTAFPLPTTPRRVHQVGIGRIQMAFIGLVIRAIVLHGADGDRAGAASRSYPAACRIAHQIKSTAQACGTQKVRGKVLSGS